MIALIASLTARQRQALEDQLMALAQPVLVVRLPETDFASVEFCDVVGELLKNHHLQSSAPLTKELFEHALVAAFLAVGVEANKLPRGFPGQDIEVAGVPWSLKTQADKDISENYVWISKFMELGKGDWVLPDLRASMLLHLQKYERIFTLRYLSANSEHGYSATEHRYELVEIPKELLQDESGKFEIAADSRQNPKPGYYTVLDSNGKTKYRLYFDGGTERKLQIQHLDKSQCKVHATWSFQRS